MWRDTVIYRNVKLLALHIYICNAKQLMLPINMCNANNFFIGHGVTFHICNTYLHLTQIFFFYILWRIFHIYDNFYICNCFHSKGSYKSHTLLSVDLNRLSLGRFGPELFCLLLGPPGFNCWFSSAPVFQWCCLTPQGSPGVCRNTFLSSPHLCFILVFICDLFVSRDDPLMS